MERAFAWRAVGNFLYVLAKMCIVSPCVLHNPLLALALGAAYNDCGHGIHWTEFPAGTVREAIMARRATVRYWEQPPTATAAGSRVISTSSPRGRTTFLPGRPTRPPSKSLPKWIDTSAAPIPSKTGTPVAWCVRCTCGGSPRGKKLMGRQRLDKTYTYRSRTPSAR